MHCSNLMDGNLPKMDILLDKILKSDIRLDTFGQNS